MTGGGPARLDLAEPARAAAPNRLPMYLIRPASSLDIDALSAIDPLAQTGSHRREFITRSVAHGLTTVIETPDAAPVGYGVLDYAFYENGFVSMLYIHPAYRRQGAATRLLRHLEGLCQTPKLFSSTNVSNLPMQALFAKTGYILSGVIQHLDENDPELVYMKYLGTSPRP